MIATESKQLEVVRLLLDYHPNAIIPRCKIETDALAIALDKGHLEIADLLLSRHINVVPSDLYRAARQTNSSETFIRILEKLRENRSPDDFHRVINGSVTKDISPLRDCASRGTADNVKALLKYGADVDAKGSNGHTALYFAAVNGHLDVVQPLLKHGADTNVTVYNGLSMLLATIQYGHYRVATVLAKHPGTDIHLAYEEETPIMACFEAYRSGISVDMELVKTLVQAGAHIDRGKIPPFAHAIMHYTSEVVSVLIDGQNRGKINQPVFTGEQSIELFCNDQNQLRSEFVEYYSHFKSEDSSGMRPLTLAIFCKKPRTAQLLINAGARATRNDQKLAAIKEIRELIIFPPSQQLLCTSGASHSQEAQATEINNPLATAIIAGTSAEDIISRYRVNKKGKKPLVDEAVVDLTESIKLLETKFSATSERDNYCKCLKRSDGKGMRPITLAVLYQNQTAFESLIKAGAFIRINDYRLAGLVNNKAMQQTIYQKLTKEHQQRLDEKHRQ
ncbi:ankyrin repeat domain-containing protein [Endozoicomonas sp. SCSIO W0465]|nr:ankyrin repeat domain-containing protein [Endozoicomonas sp. SCSIO W0465]USE34355.1 ankyrin repeat domain-containing protein [Endozoicomonas sp. SCSIO W0465]